MTNWKYTRPAVNLSSSSSLPSFHSIMRASSCFSTISTACLMSRINWWTSSVVASRDSFRMSAITHPFLPSLFRDLLVFLLRGGSLAPRLLVNLGLEEADEGHLLLQLGRLVEVL